MKEVNQSVFIWISRHELSQDQIGELVDLGIDPADIHQPGDVDAFEKNEIEEKINLIRLGYSQPIKIIVGVVHPAAALTVHKLGHTVAVSKNINRAPEGERPRFEFEKWCMY